MITAPPREWDDSADVIVIGSGCAGLAAAIAAAESGVAVLMLEKNPELGGTTRWSVGSVTTSSSPHQRRAGIMDDPDQHFRDMERFHGKDLKGRDNEVLRRLLVDAMPETFDWLLSTGLVFHGPMPEPPHTKPRMHNVLPNSRVLVHQLSRRAERLGIRILTSVPMEDLIVGSERVQGVMALGRSLRARRAVILAMGDFSGDRRLKERYMPAQIARVSGFNPASTGDWHDPVTALGGRVLNGDIVLGPEIRFIPPTRETFIRRLPPWAWLGNVMRWAIVNLPPRLLRPFAMGFLTTALMPSLELYRRGAILINREGRRFTDERARPWADLVSQPGGDAFILLDAALASAFSSWPGFISTAPGIAYAYLDDYRRSRPDLFHQASTLREVAGSADIDPDNLEQAVNDHNLAGRGDLPLLCNPPFTLLGPVRAIIPAGDGGLAVNTRLQVLGEGDEPIAGLYAAGSTGQGGLLLEGHGHHLGWGFASGRIAGRNAAGDLP